MPAEWERHDATWLGWPLNKTDWPGKFTPIPWVYAEIIRRITPGELVRLLVESPAHEAAARRVLKRAGADLSRVEFLRFPINRGWTRDSGPIFVTRERSPRLAIVDFRFNAWAKYPDWQKDARVPARAATKLGCPLLPAIYEGRPFVLEGGAVDFNGAGTVITTEECLLDPHVQARNPGLSRSQVEEALHGFFGAGNVLWLGRGIEGDDTHGHVDDVCRFINARTVVLAREKNGNDYNHRVLEENRERLQDMRLEDRSRIEVIDLPMPEPLYFEGRRLPASYANFYMTNAAVLVPTFNDPHDRIALGTLAEVVTDRPVIGIHAVDLVWGLGTLHCLSREQPAV